MFVIVSKQEVKGSQEAQSYVKSFSKFVNTSHGNFDLYLAQIQMHMFLKFIECKLFKNHH